MLCLTILGRSHVSRVKVALKIFTACRGGPAIVLGMEYQLRSLTLTPSRSNWVEVVIVGRRCRSSGVLSTDPYDGVACHGDRDVSQSSVSSASHTGRSRVQPTHLIYTSSSFAKRTSAHRKKVGISLCSVSKMHTVGNMCLVFTCATFFWAEP
jgi:hypothetical protein